MTVDTSTGAFEDDTVPEPVDYKAPKVKHKVKICWRNVIILTYFHIACIYGIYLALTDTKWQTFAWVALQYVISKIGITAGVHRYWTHRSYKAKLPLRIILMFFFILTFEGKLYFWVRDHRVHHKYQETDADPYNAGRGFWFAHMTWLMQSKHPEVLKKIFKHHIDKVPDSDGHANLRIAPEMSEHIPYDRIIPHHLPLVNDMSSNQISYGNNYSDMSLQTHFAPTSPEQSQNIFIPPAHDTGYSSSIRSNSSVDISPISPGKMNANYFPHNFSPQKQTGDSRTSSIENISAIIRSSNENIHNTSSPSPKVTTPPENLSEQFFGGTPIHVVHNLPTGRISKSSSVEDNVEETLSATSPFWHNEDRPSAFIPYVLLEAQTAISRVMGRPQQAVTVTNKMRHRYENAAKKIESHITSSSQKSSSPNHPHTSPSFPNVLQKSESWHQMVKEKMAQAKQAPPLPKISKAKSSHALAFPKQFEASLPKETLSVKQSTIDQYLKKSPVTTSSSISKSKEKKTVTIKSVIKLDDDLNNVDEAFENLFQETSKKRVNK